MTLNEFINQLETFVPNIHAELVVKVAGSDALHKIWVAGGDAKVTFYIEPIKEQKC